MIQVSQATFDAIQLLRDNSVNNVQVYTANSESFATQRDAEQTKLDELNAVLTDLEVV